MNKDFILNNKINDIIEEYPFAKDFFKNNNLEIDFNLTLIEYNNSLDYETKEDNAFNLELFSNQLLSYINQMLEFLGETQTQILKLTIIAGNDKNGKKDSI